MIFNNIFKTLSIRHYASADKNKVVLGLKFGTLDDIRITLSTQKFQSILSQLNKINDTITGPTDESPKIARQSNTKSPKSSN